MNMSHSLSPPRITSILFVYEGDAKSTEQRRSVLLWSSRIRTVRPPCPEPPPRGQLVPAVTRRQFAPKNSSTAATMDFPSMEILVVWGIASPLLILSALGLRP